MSAAADQNFAQCSARIAASGLASERVAESWIKEASRSGERLVAGLKPLLAELVLSKRLTCFQAEALLRDPPMRLVLGRYVLLDLLGEGGMGQVFKARHDRLDRLVAVKLLHEHAFDSPEAVLRFHREVKTAGMLAHPHIVHAYDADEWEGRHYLVMEYVDGRDLATVARERRVAIEEAADWVVQAARGLAHAHSQGVVHRDIKPSNLLLDSAGVVKVLDLGIARVRDDEPADAERTTATQLTQAGAIFGTVDFMAPEQALNLRHADARSDVYSLGCSLFQILTGRPAFEGATVIEKIIAHRERELPSLRGFRPDAPEWLEAVVERMVAKLPEDRLQSMHEVVAALEGLAQSSLQAASAPTLAGASVAAPLAQPTHRFDSSTAIINAGAAPPAASGALAESSKINRLRRLLDGCTAVDRFLCSDEESQIFRTASDLDCSLEEIEAAIAGECAARGWTRQTKLSTELTKMLEDAAQIGRAIERREFEEIIGYAVERHMPRKAALEHCLTLMLNKRLPVREGLLDKWFSRLCRQFGLN